jgi:predicted Rossmann-fold nucleotide-binding protein
MFASFAQREAELVDRAQAIVVVVGGVGTSWEIFEALTKKQTKKIKDIPIVFLGGEESWSALLQYIDHLARLKKISPEDKKSFKIVASAEEAVELLKGLLPLENKGQGR